MKYLTRTRHGARLVVLLLVIAWWSLPPPARAWGVEGHQVLALVAQARLTPKAKAEVDHLLALEPGASLASLSNWADEHRSPATKAWHYVNFPRGNCHYEAARDCPDGHCVVEEIRKQAHILGAHGADAQRLKALKYLIHLVGDVHQPLHAGFLDDRGGNSYTLQSFMRASDLHAVWDAGLIRYLAETPEHMADRLAPLVDGLPIADLDPTDAAQESCAIVSLEGFYPDHRIDMRYIARYTPVMERRLATAGGRLAGLLNQLFQ